MRAIFAFLILTLVTAGCVRLDGLDPDTGPERTLVEIDGSTFLSTVIWNAGTASEQSLPGGFLAASVFTVPDGAPLGAHDVALEQGSRRTDTLPFTVTAAQPFTAPRVDRISLVFASFDAADVTTWLYVQGANGDVGAEVLVNGAVQPTVAHKGLRNELFGIAPTDFGFPIYHWVSYIVPWTGPAGSSINVQLRNADGQNSATRAYTLPGSATTLDRDGDDIPDDWEINGFDADGDGTIDIDLSALGADPLRPDVFVEVDIMNGLDNPPTNATWNGIDQVFDAAPFINPSGPNGINMVIDNSGSVPFWQAIDFNIPQNMMLSQEDFYTLKAANFDNAARGRIYHYGIWANARPNNTSGVSDVNFTTGNGGDDFIVSFDDFSSTYQTEKSRIATFAHEFGHDLSLRHGGGDNTRYNPSHNSVMSYSWQLRTGLSNDATRVSRPVYSPLYYLTTGAHETDGALPGSFSDDANYSVGMGRDLDEDCLDEATGLYDGRDIDWNNDGDTTDACAARDINTDGDTADVASDFASWANITFVGPRTNGRFGG